MQQRYRSLALLQILTAVGIVAFWVAFFTVGLAPAVPPPGYFEFEHAFPLPDLLLAAGLIAAGGFLRSKRDESRTVGRALSLVCAGALLFLGFVDLSFNVQNGIYTVSLGDGVMAAAVQAWCIGFGTWTIAVCRG
jgi:hypothetical protein